VIRVLLADDHTLVSNGVRLLLESVGGIEVIAETRDGSEAVRRSMELSPDVAVLDIAMPNLNGIEAARRIHAECPATRVIMLSMHADEEYVGAAIQAGVRGYVLKGEAFTQLLAAIQSVQAGGVFLSPSLAKQSLEDYRRLAQSSGPAPALEKISGREREILQLIAEGHANSEIAQLLKLSVRTVETHRARIMDKLGVTTTAGLTRFAIRHGLTELEP